MSVDICILFDPIFIIWARTKYFILPLRVLLSSSKCFSAKSFILKPIHKAAETNFS